jgi:acyl-CoA thioesterase
VRAVQTAHFQDASTVRWSGGSNFGFNGNLNHAEDFVEVKNSDKNRTFEAKTAHPMNIFDYFKNDRYAALTGIELLDAGLGYAKASLQIDERHQNANGVAQGGVLFTLADFVTGVASNSHGDMAVSISGHVAFLQSSVPGDELTAEATERFLHKRLGNYQVDVTNQRGELVATLETTVYRKAQKTGLTL